MITRKPQPQASLNNSSQSQNWQRISALAATIFAFFVLLALPLRAATIITTPEVVLTFDTQPDVADWSTANIAGAGADIVDGAAMDARVAMLTADQINTPLVPSATAGGSGTNALARYNTTELYVSTRPTGVALTPLMATLQNGTNGRITQLAVEYDFGAYAPVAPDPELEGHRVYFSLDGSTWTRIDPLSNVGTPQRLMTSLNVANVANWEPEALLYLLWADDNGNGTTDGGFTIDNMRFVPTVEPIIIGRNLIYNRVHTAGGAPNGNLATSGNYFLEGNTPTAFAATDVANFSQDGGAIISVPTDVTAGGIVVSNNTGTYTFNGPGKIAGPFTKSNAGTAIFTSPNSFNRSTITGGTVETRAGALGSGSVSMSNGALWKVTTIAQTQIGLLDVGTGGATIQTDADLTAGGLNGTGLLTKTGSATLSLTGAGGGSGGINVVAGKLSAATDSALGGNTQSITLNGNTLEFTNAADITFSDATKTRTIVIGATPTSISVTAPGAANPGAVGVIIGNPDTLTGSGTITKIGDGALRMRADHPNLTSNWVIDAGTLEYNSANALGSGTVTVNALGRFAGRSVPVSSNVTLNGGDLGTRTDDLTDFTGTINVAAPSTVTLKSFSTPANGQDITISGTLSGSSALTVNGVAATNGNGAKALILSNSANTYTGTITVTTDQALIVNGNLPSASNITADGRLGGKGTVGGATINALGTLAPGLFVDTSIVQPNPVLDGPGILSVSRNLSLASTAIVALDLDHGFGAAPVAGTDYDQVVVGTGVGAVSTGSVTLGGSDLVLTIGLNGILPNDKFFILTNDGVDAIPDTFNNLPNKSFVTVGNQTFQISYDANSTTGLFTGGNDIAIFAIPEPGTVGLLLLGSALFLPRRRRQ